MGGRTWPASPTRAVRGPDETFGVEARDREMRAGADLADAAEQTVKPLCERGFESLGIETHQSVDLRALANPDHA